MRGRVRCFKEQRRPWPRGDRSATLWRVIPARSTGARPTGRLRGPASPPATDHMMGIHRTATAILLTGLALVQSSPPPAAAELGLTLQAVSFDPEGKRLYELGCASCHGLDGTGPPPDGVDFNILLPDFTDCAFASREPDADWVAVAHQGGPVRGFDETMPAFGEAFDVDQLLLIIDYVRSFCPDPSWPRGELNLPRALVTEKAYPEDEAVTTVVVNAGSTGGVVNQLVYEKRFGSRNQVEIELPFGVREVGDDGSWKGGVGDLAVALKRAVWHTGASIVSLGGEVKLPTGDRDDGFGTGTVVVEPFVAFGRALPSDAFFQLQGIVELPTQSDKAEREALWRAVLGKTWTEGEWGRAWSPMVEILGARELESGASTEWDLVPQMQVTLNTRQHVMLNVGARLPVTQTDVRDPQILVYLLWDWFDGGFFDGW